MVRADRVLFLVLATAVFAYVIVRAWLVPMAHDECASVLWFVRPGTWLPWQAHWDANNHYLSSSIAVLSTRLFGEAPWTLRIGSLLAFPVYTWAVWRLGAHVRSRVPRHCMWAALLLCPYLLDFFSLFRGYGIEMAGWLVALDGVLRYARSGATRHLTQALAGMLFATAAIVALVPAWVLVLVFLVVLMWGVLPPLSRGSRWAQTTLWLVLGAFPLYGACQLALALKDRGLLYHGSTDGFFKVTVTSLGRYVLGNDTVAVGVLVSVVLLGCGALAVREVVRQRTWRDPLLLTTALLWGEVLARSVMARAFTVNYPEDRAALHLVPVAVVAVALAADRMAARNPRMAWTATLLWVLPLRSLMTANVDHTLAWPEQAVPERFMARAQDHAGRVSHALLVGGQHQLALAWPMNAHWLDQAVPPMQVNGFPEGLHDLRIVDERYLQQALHGYHAIDSASGPGLWLLERDQPLRMEPLVTLHAPERSAREEFSELAHVPDSLLRGTPVQLVVDVPLTLPSPSPDVRLVLEVNDANGNKLFYDALAPLALRPAWYGERLWQVWRPPALPDARRAVIYFHNPGGVIVSHGPARTQVSAIRE